MRPAINHQPDLPDEVLFVQIFILEVELPSDAGAQQRTAVTQYQNEKAIRAPGIVQFICFIRSRAIRIHVRIHPDTEPNGHCEINEIILETKRAFVCLPRQSAENKKIKYRLKYSRFRVIAWDLGLQPEESALLNNLPPFYLANWQLRTFDFTKYPPHFDMAQNCGGMAFRPTVIAQAAQELSTLDPPTFYGSTPVASSAEVPLNIWPSLTLTASIARQPTV